MIFFIIINFKISLKGDPFLLKVFSFTNIGNKAISQMFCFLGLFIIVSSCAKNNFLLYYSKENLTKDELKELPEEQVNKILEFTSNINSSKLKTLKIQIIHNKNKHYKPYIILYFLNDLWLYHFETCIIFVILNDFDINFCVKLLYLLLMILLNFIKFCILSEIEYTITYLTLFFTCYLFTLRLLLLSLSILKIIYFICQINLLLIIIYYSTDKRKNKFISIIMTFYILFNLTNVNFFFMALDLLSLFLSPIVKDYLIKKKNNNNDASKDKKEEKTKFNFSLIFFLFILVMFIFQLYGICNYKKIINVFYENYSNKNHEDIIFDVRHNKVKRRKTSIEYYFINEIFAFLHIKK